MRILLTNDDGIHAPGLEALEAIARELSDDVVVVAPETDQSGVSHSLSLSDPLRLRRVGETRYAVRGTPTDCVIMAVQHLLADRRPDLVLSGVNRGANLGEDVTYSGTVAGAMEGTLLGIPSVAISQHYGAHTAEADLRWHCAVAHAPAILRKLVEGGIARGILYNVNFPDLEPEALRGIRATVQGVRDQAALMDVNPREDFRGRPYYWLSFVREDRQAREGTDLRAVADGYASVTPLRLDLTDAEALRRLDGVFDTA